MSCSQYDFLESAHWKAMEEAERLRLFGPAPHSVSSLDALVGAELNRSILDAARSKHLRDCRACVVER